MATEEIAGVRIPDSNIARQATQLIRDTISDFLFRHSTRVYMWGALTGQRKGLMFDPELLYVSAMFHDLGLTRGYRLSRLRFEVDGANAARDFLRGHNIPESAIERVWAGIALHTTPSVPQFMHPNIALVQAGAAMDVMGHGFDEFMEEQRRAVMTAYPRGEDFAHTMIDAFYEGMKHRPDSTYGTFNDDVLAFKDPAFRRANLCSMMLSSPWTRDHQQPQTNLHA